MSYAVKEIFYTLQGEGARAGRAAVFCRFAGCNLWSGREADRATARCGYCDTDFVGTDGPGGGRFPDAATLAAAVAAAWPAGAGGFPYVVCTGGEPLLQLDQALVDAFHALGFEVGVETNGSQPAPAGIDWLCVSPKAGVPLVLTAGDELKVVLPHQGPAGEALDLDALARLPFSHHFVQPLDAGAAGGPDPGHRAAAVAYCLAHPRWRLSLQTHKLLGIP